MSTTTTSPDVATTIQTMRIGFTAGMYPVPDSIEPDARADWHLTRSSELGCTALQLLFAPSTSRARQDLGARAASLGIELEGMVFSLFPPLGAAPDSNLEKLREQLAQASEMGLTVVRGGYGRLTLETTRFARERNAREQLDHMIASLRAASPLAEEYGIPIAVENHCDFTGRELAGVLAEVGSEWIGCALDTANGFTVFCDPNDDVDALAEHAFTTHIKDMAMRPSPVSGLIPVLPFGCGLGEGHVDIPRAVELLAQRSPKAQSLHLIVESGWEPIDDPDDPDPTEVRRSNLESGVRYLQDLVSASSRV